MLYVIGLYLLVSVIYIIIVVALAGGPNEISQQTEQGITTWLFFISILILLIIGLVWLKRDLTTLYPIISHIDKSKTKVIKENNKTKEIFITVNDKEYHFTFDITEGD